MVDFVGAGCGAADLITLRGKRLLEQADVIIYAGSLVNPQLLDYAKQGCRIYNSALMHLDEVIDVMQKAESEGLHTVRLHTGDPSVYGAIREQMDRLDALGIHNISGIMKYIISLSGVITNESAASIVEIKTRIEDIYNALENIWRVVAFEPGDAEEIERTLEWIAIGDPSTVTRIADSLSSRYGVERRTAPAIYFADKPPGERYSGHITREDLQRYYPQYFE